MDSDGVITAAASRSLHEEMPPPSYYSFKNTNNTPVVSSTLFCPVYYSIILIMMNCHMDYLHLKRRKISYFVYHLKNHILLFNNVVDWEIIDPNNRKSSTDITV